MLLKRHVLKVVSNVALTLTVSKIIKFIIFDVEKVGQGPEVIRYNFPNAIIRWQILKYLKVVECIHALAHTVSVI